MTLLPVERRTKKAVAMPAIPAPTTTTSTVRSERSGRGGSSGPSWASHGDRFGQSAYLDAGDPGAAFHRTSVISRARTHHEVDRGEPYRSGRLEQPGSGLAFPDNAARAAPLSAPNKRRGKDART